MQRTRMLFMVAAVTVAMLVATALPAMAESPANSTIFYPYGNGITYSCTGGPPFVVGPRSPDANCVLQQIGPPPAGLVCDVPIAITFVHDMHRETYNGRSCHSSAAGA